MKRILLHILKFVIVLLIIMGLFLIYKNSSDANSPRSAEGKPAALKKYLLTYEKPQRIEIFNYSKRFEDEIKKMKISQDKNSNFYISIQFFTDESDDKAPLIAQIRFIDLKTNNTMKEESINLE
jgi:uncharacterized protein YxeA